jgi:hypothetical protein
MAFFSLKYTFICKKILEANQCGSGSKTALFSKFADLRFADWETKEICAQLRINHYKFEDLQFEKWQTSEIFRLVIAE